jgi:alpha-L-rhamnosidase
MGATRMSRRTFLRLLKGIGLKSPFGRLFEKATALAEITQQEAPVGLLCDLKANPIGVEAETQRFSWVVGYTERDEWQTAYQILVKLVVTGGTVWDSGKVLSAESTNVDYGGAALLPGCVYDWQVRTWNKLDVPGAYSDPQMVATALDSWLAVPIWSGTGSFAYLRRQITLPGKPISAAIAYVTGNTTDRLLGAYRLYVNAHWVGTGPGRGCGGDVPYDVYDVSQWLTAGTANVVAAQGYAESNGKFLLQLKVFYQDGTEDVFVTDDQWKAIDADTIYNPTGSTASYYTQPHEYIDARNFQVGWQSVGFDDSSWPSAVERSAFGSLVAKPTYPLEIHEQSPVTVVQKASGDYFVDFGQEIMGGIRLSLTGSAGQVLELGLGEELSGTNTVMYNPLRTGNVFRNYWTLRDGAQTIEHHEYLEFRYGEVLDSPQPLDADDIKAWVVRYPFDDGESDFDSSSSALNGVWDFCKYTIKATTLDVYTDSNVRERGPYEGDAYVNGLSHYAVAKEFLVQRYTTAFLLENPTWPTEWPICSVLMAHADYMATGDPCLTEQYYTLLKANTLQGYLNGDNLIEKSTTNDLVDWPSNMRDGFVFTTINTVVNAYACRAMQLMAELARAIGENADADQFEADALALKDAMHTYLFNGTQYKDGWGTSHVSLHANMFPLAFDLVPPANRASVAALINSRGMVCSPYGAQFLLEALYNAEEDEAALGFMTAATGNSWVDMMNRGATTTCEAWNYGQKPNMTWSHPWGTPPSNIIPRYLMGVQPLSPGYGYVRIKPQPGSLEWASLDVPTIKGTIHVEFVQEPERFTLRVTFPANTRAKVYLPKLDIDDALVLVDGALQTGVLDGNYVYLDDVGSGAHEFIRMPTERAYLPLVVG